MILQQPYTQLTDNHTHTPHTHNLTTSCTLDTNIQHLFDKRIITTHTNDTSTTFFNKAYNYNTQTREQKCIQELQKHHIQNITVVHIKYIYIYTNTATIYLNTTKIKNKYNTTFNQHIKSITN